MSNMKKKLQLLKFLVKTVLKIQMEIYFTILHMRFFG